MHFENFNLYLYLHADLQIGNIRQNQNYITARIDYYTNGQAFSPTWIICQMTSK